MWFSVVKTFVDLLNGIKAKKDLLEETTCIVLYHWQQCNSLLVHIGPYICVIRLIVNTESITKYNYKNIIYALGHGVMGKSTSQY